MAVSSVKRAVVSVEEGDGERLVGFNQGVLNGLNSDQL